MSYSDMTMQLVFKGKLGNEDGAVAVSAPKPIDGIYSGLSLALPTTGVYAKTSSNSINVTFNELKVNVSNTGQTDLTGGAFELVMRYRTATTDPFQSQQVATEPAGAYAYIARYPANSGASTLPKNSSADLVFDISTAPISMKSTDVEMFIVYKGINNQPVAVGYRNISEPTPIDVFNNTDYSCLNSVWYKYDDPAAMAIVDSNGDGIADRNDIYPHTISNISFLAGSADAVTLDATASSTLFAAGTLQTGQMLRMGYILTDYTNRFAISEARTEPGGDPWPNSTANNKIFPGSGFRNDGNTWGNMFTFRGSKTWWGEGVIFINKEYNGTCTWDALLAKYGL